MNEQSCHSDARCDGNSLPSLPLEIPLAANRQRVVFQADINVLLLDARNLEFQRNFVLVFVDVHGGNKAASRGQFVLARAAVVLKQAVDAILQCCELTERIPTSDNHDVCNLLNLLSKSELCRAHCPFASLDAI